MIFDIRILFFLDLLCGLYYHILNIFKLFLFAYKRDHDLGYDIIALLCFYLNGCFHYCPGLHPCDLGICNRKTASAVTHHGIELMK